MNIFQVGDRVKRSDADSASIPAYRNMRGTVINVHKPEVFPGMIRNRHLIAVKWDCDGNLSPSNVPVEWLAFSD